MRKSITVAALAAFVLAGCTPPDDAPRPESDAAGGFEASARAPVDDHIYNLEVEVRAAPSSLVRQTDPGGGSIVGINGYTSGHITGPTNDGKGYLRVTIFSIEPYLPDDAVEHEPADWFSTGDTLIVKTTDTKATALAEGDRVLLRCRAEYEAVAAIRSDETFDADQYETWELDFCRIATPVVRDSE